MCIKNRRYFAPEFKTTCLNSFFILFSKFFFIFFIDGFAVVDVMKPKVDTERNSFQTLVEYL